MSDISRTTITPICRKCGVELGQSYVYCADGFMYHHMCYPVSPSQAKIAELERQLASRDAFIVDRGLWSEFVDTLPPAKSKIPSE